MLIGQLAAETGVNIQTIRYYERVGLLAVPPRTEGRHRIYDPRDVQRLTFIRRSRELGFDLEDVRTFGRQGGLLCKGPYASPPSQRAGQDREPQEA